MADEQYFTKMVDGQLSVATVAQTGEIIPEEDRPGDKYTTAMVQTSDGPQLCVKTYDMNGGGGGGGTVDQTYDPTSTNAQSGTAVAEAVAPALKNIATGTSSLQVGGTTPNSYNDVVLIGPRANAYGTNSIAISSGNSSASSYISGLAIGNSTAIGTGSIAISPNNAAYSTAANSIQLGGGNNVTANSFQVFSYQMLDGTTGKIPMARLPIVQCTQAEYDALVSGGTVDSNTIYCIIPA